MRNAFVCRNNATMLIFVKFWRVWADASVTCAAGVAQRSRSGRACSSSMNACRYRPYPDESGSSLGASPNPLHRGDIHLSFRKAIISCGKATFSPEMCLALRRWGVWRQVGARSAAESFSSKNFIVITPFAPNR